MASTSFPEVHHLVEAIDYYVEATRAEGRDDLLIPIEGRVAKAIRAGFKKQGKAFLKGLEGIKGQLEVTESRRRIREADAPAWEPIWDDAAAEGDPGMTAGLDAGAADALLAGGVATSTSFGLANSFDLSNPRAVRYLDQYGADLVSGVDDTTRDTLNRLLTGGMQQGLSYEKIAASIRGEFDNWAEPQEHIRDRAEMVAVTETAKAYEAGSRAVIQDLQASGLEMEKKWLPVDDPCPVCTDAAAQDWIAADDGFAGGDDTPPAHPSCFPAGTRVIADSVVAGAVRWYAGELVEVVTADGHVLTATPNHPVLTCHGWAPIGSLKPGSHVIGSRGGDWALGGGPDDDRRPALIEQVMQALGDAPAVTAVRVPTTAEDFHGDGINGEVCVVRADRELLNRLEPAPQEQVAQGDLARADMGERALATERHPAGLLEGANAAGRGTVSRGAVGAALLNRPAGLLEPVGLEDGAQDASRPQVLRDRRSAHPQGAGQGRDGLAGQVAVDQVHGRLPAIDSGLLTYGPAPESVAVEPRADGRLADSQAARQADDGFAGGIALDQVVAVGRFPWSGHVYNLETLSGRYIAEGILVSNCRCTTLYRRVGSGSAGEG